MDLLYRDPDGSAANAVVHDLGRASPGAVVQLGYTKGLTFCGNIVRGGDTNPIGLYIWGNSRYNKQPGEDVIVSDNQISAAETAISLNGTRNVRIHGNLLTAPNPLIHKRTEGLSVGK